MKKKPLFLILVIVVSAIYSCEKEDFCAQDAATPNLVLRFYDKDTIKNTKSVERLSIIAKSKTDSLFTNQTTDSIAIPLNSLANETVYTLKMNDEDGITANNQVATLTIKYTPEEEYVSRACGFRVIFNDVTLEKTLWIDSLSTKSIKTINNQTNAHVKIYH